MANSGKLLRLLKIISLIERRQGATLSYLAEECSVSARTIYRDIDALALSGMPVYFDTPARCYRFTDKVFLRPLSFSVDEATAMLHCLQAFHKERTPFRAALRQAQEKVMSCLPSERQRQVDEGRKAVDIKIPSRSSEVCADIFSCVESAISEKRRIRLNYYTKSRETWSERTIDPYVIAFRGGAWYLVAFCHLRSSVILFRMDRIRDAKVLRENFELPRNFSADAYFAGSWLVEQGEPIHVRLRFFPEAARWVKEVKYHPSQTLTEHDDGSLIFEATVNGQREILRWIMGYGAEVEVIEPDELRYVVSGQITEMARLYKIHGGS